MKSDFGNSEEAKTKVCELIDDLEHELLEVSHAIHDEPELGYEEHKAHEILTSTLINHGLNTERSAYGIKTAFEAKAGNDAWIHDFGTEVEGTVGHKINTAFTSNNVAIQKGAGWLAGLLTITKKTKPVKNWEDPDAEWDDPEKRDERSKEEFDKYNTGYGSHYW